MNPIISYQENWHWKNVTESFIDRKCKTGGISTFYKIFMEIQFFKFEGLIHENVMNTEIHLSKSRLALLGFSCICGT